MAHLLYNHDEFLGAWAAKHIPHVERAGGFGEFKAVGVATGPDKADKLMAVCVYHTYNAEYQTCQISMVSRDPRWASKGTIRSLLSFPFIQYKVHKCWTATPHDSTRVIRFNEAIGFKREALLRHQFGKGKHAVICSMIWPEYKKRYLPNWDDGRSVIMNEAVH